jgi:hypothetical protein
MNTFSERALGERMQQSHGLHDRLPLDTWDFLPKTEAMNNNGNHILDSNTIDDREPVRGIRGTLRRWVSACAATVDKYYLGFGQGG